MLISSKRESKMLISSKNFNLGFKSLYFKSDFDLDIPKLDNNTLLDLSIESWELLLIGYKDHNFKGVEVKDVTNCSLCLKYHANSYLENDNTKSGDCCYNCPIANKTNEPYCDNTPFKVYNNLSLLKQYYDMGVKQENWPVYLKSLYSEYISDDILDESKFWKDLISSVEQEIEFLKSLKE